MGLLDQILGGLMNGGLGQAREEQAPSAQAGGMGPAIVALLPVILSMLANRQGGGASTGGLGGLLEQFQRTGYGQQADSWVGKGANLPISPDVIAQVFGRDGVARIASQAGVSEQDASAGLSQLLPEVVDRMTPEGRMPDLDSLAASVGDLQRRFGL